jgi:hypothetical protein
VRARFDELLREPLREPPPVAAPIDRDAITAEVERAVRAAIPAPEPAPIVPQSFADLSMGIATCPMGTNAEGWLRGGLSLRVAEIVRVAIEIGFGAGGAGDRIGDVVLIAAGGAASLRLAHTTRDLVLEAGARADLGWVRAQGISAPGVRGLSLDALSTTIGLDARLRAHLIDIVWLLIGADLGAQLTGIDARAEDRRVVAQLGPRIALTIGLSFPL